LRDQPDGRERVTQVGHPQEGVTPHAGLPGSAGPVRSWRLTGAGMVPGAAGLAGVAGAGGTDLVAASAVGSGEVQRSLQPGSDIMVPRLGTQHEQRVLAIPARRQDLLS